LSSKRLFELYESLTKQFVAVETEIDPLGKIAEKSPGIRLPGVERSE